MSIEQAMILRARPQMMARRLAAILETEVVKGCLPDIAPRPVRLEPSFWRILTEPPPQATPHEVFEEPLPFEKWTRLRLWISSRQKCEWNRSELFLKQLSGLSRRLG